MRLNALLNTVFTQLGVDITDAKTQSILGNANIANIEVPEELSNKLTAAQFYTKEAALQNPEIRNQIRAEALNGVDSLIGELGKKYELDYDSMEVINSQDKSTKKYQKLVDSIAELQSKKASAGKDSKQLEEYNNQMLKLKEKHAEELKSERTARKTDKLNWQLDSIYNSIDYSMEAPKEVAKRASRAVVEELARERGITFDMADDSSIRLVTRDGTDHFDNNIKLSAADYIKKTLAENKLMKTVNADSAPARRGYETQQPSTPKYNSFEYNPAPQIPTGSNFERAIDSMMSMSAPNPNA